MPDGVEVIGASRAGLFPAELWKWYNHMMPERARKRNLITADADGRSLYVTTAYRLETDVPVDRQLFSSCLRGLRPVAEVGRLLLPREGPNGLAARVGVHIRMMVDQATDVPGIEQDTRADSNLGMMNEARPYREACHHSAFVGAMRAQLAAEPSCPRGRSNVLAPGPWPLASDPKPSCPRGRSNATNGTGTAVPCPWPSALGHQPLAISAHQPARALHCLSRVSRTRFYLAADSEDAYRAVYAAFEPGVVMSLPLSVLAECNGPANGNATATLTATSSGVGAPWSGWQVGGQVSGQVGGAGGRRGAACQVAALADMLNLGATGRLLLSHWSSWEDVLLSASRASIRALTCAAHLALFPSSCARLDSTRLDSTRLDLRFLTVGVCASPSVRRKAHGGGRDGARRRLQAASCLRGASGEASGTRDPAGGEGGKG